VSNWKIEARQHFANQRTPATLKTIPVPEWPALGTVYYWPRLSLAEDRAIKLCTGVMDANESGMRFDTVAARVTEFIVRARDEHGRLLFTQAEFDDVLGGYDPDVISRVVIEMLTEPAPTAEHVSKN
jgi:hypothetical protein